MDFLPSPKKLKLDNIPTEVDVLRAFFYEKEKWLAEKKTKKDPGSSVIADIITEKIQQIYHTAGMNTLRKDKIKQKVNKIYNSRKELLRIGRTKRYSETFAEKELEYLSRMDVPFDVTDNNDSRRRDKVVHRKQFKKTTTFHEPPLTCKRKASVLSRQKSYAVITNDEYEKTIETDDKDSDFQPQYAESTTKRNNLSRIIEVQSRYASSDRLTSAIVNATLEEFDIPIIIDKSKLRRAQKRKFSEVDCYPVVFGGGLYYDSRKDLTIIQNKKKDESGTFKFYKTIRRVDHCSFVSEPTGVFLGFIEIKKGDAKSSSMDIISFLKDKNVLDELNVLGNDGTNVNVGSTGGINHFIEIELDRPLHWFICLLHANELPLKTLIVKLDGRTTGRKSFSGPIGKALETVDNSPIVNFKKFRNCELLPQLPDDVYKKMSNDQKYLFRIVNALVSGKFPQSLSQLKIGELNHSRWITLASRVCKLYASSTQPSENLKLITSYIVQVYAPTWFEIKRNELAINGPKNLFFLIQKSNLIKNDNAKSLVQKCIQRNAFFAHSENVLLAQLSSENRSYRIDAVNKILRIRDRIPDGTVRIFKVPKLNFQAQSWTEIASSNESSMTEPPLTLNLNEQELIDIIHTPLVVPKFRCHTQMVERAVKEVTRVSKTVINHEKRNAMVKLTLINRSNYPKLESKKDFLVDVNKPVSYLPKI